MAETVATGVSDPSVDQDLLAWHVPGATGVLVKDGEQIRLKGSHPALGGGRLAMLANDTIFVQEMRGPQFEFSVRAPDADAIAVATDWVAWRARSGDRDHIFAASLAGGAPRRIASGRELGRPALAGNLLAYHLTGRAGSRIVIADLTSGSKATVRRERRALLLNPALQDGRLLYVRSVYTRQELRIGPQARRSPRRDQRMWSMVPTGRRDSGHEPGKRHHRHGWPRKLWSRPRRGLSATLWTTALAADGAYFTVLRQMAGEPLAAAIMRVDS